VFEHVWSVFWCNLDATRKGAGLRISSKQQLVDSYIAFSLFLWMSRMFQKWWPRRGTRMVRQGCVTRFNLPLSLKWVFTFESDDLIAETIFFTILKYAMMYSFYSFWLQSTLHVVFPGCLLHWPFTEGSSPCQSKSMSASPRSMLNSSLPFSPIRQVRRFRLCMINSFTIKLFVIIDCTNFLFYYPRQTAIWPSCQNHWT